MCRIVRRDAPHERFADANRPTAVCGSATMAASKELGQWLAGRARQVRHPRGALDRSRPSAAHVVRADPTSVCTALARTIGRPDPGGRPVASADDTARAALDAVIAAHPEPTEPAMPATRSRRCPRAEPCGASSMPVRDLEWLRLPGPGAACWPTGRERHRRRGVHRRRRGVGRTSPGHRALVGDVALLHDTNGLLRLADRPVDLTLVVVDNDGGGIFSFLPQARRPCRRSVRATVRHPARCRPAVLAAAHGIMTIEPAARGDGSGDLGLGGAGGVRLVRVRTNRAANVAVHDEIVAQVGRRLADFPR